MLLQTEGVEDTDLSGVEHFTEVGVIAQEVETIPELAFMCGTKDDLKTVKMINLIGYLINGFQEQKLKS